MSNMAYKTKRVKSWMDRFIKVTFWAEYILYLLEMFTLYVDFDEQNCIGLSITNILLKLDIPVLLRAVCLLIEFSNSTVFLYFKVKQYDAFKGDYVKGEDFSSKNLSPNVLAQHGIQLLMERECSFFFPAGIVGILCIGTKVGF